MSSAPTAYVDWIHCNNCYKLPVNMGQIFFSSCGHVLCGKCGINEELNTPISICPVCRNQTKLMIVDKNLNPDLKMYFRHPHEIATQFMQQLKKVLDFQSSNRQRLSKYHQERTLRIQKFAENNGSQFKKMQEAAKKLHQEKQALLIETKAVKQQYNNLNQRYKQVEARLRQKEQQLSGLNKAPGTIRGSSDSGVESINSLNTDFSFSSSGFLTSTPIPRDGISPKSHVTSHRQLTPDIFQGKGKLSPITSFNSSLFDTKPRRTASANIELRDRMSPF